MLSWLDVLDSSLSISIYTLPVSMSCLSVSVRVLPILLSKSALFWALSVGFCSPSIKHNYRECFKCLKNESIITAVLKARSIFLLITLLGDVQAWWRGWLIELSLKETFSIIQRKNTWCTKCTHKNTIVHSIYLSLHPFSYLHSFFIVILSHSAITPLISTSLICLLLFRITSRTFWSRALWLCLFLNSIISIRITLVFQQF